MTEKLTHAAHVRNLRKKAEELVMSKADRIKESVSPEELREMVHELHVHQVELEIQNEELRRTQHELEVSRSRYVSLYDLAPVGYLTVSEEGIILEANLTVASLFGMDRSALLGQPLSRFILPADKDTYFLHRKKHFEAGELQTWEMRMTPATGPPFWVALQAVPGQNGEYWITLSDITGRKQLEEALKEEVNSFEAVRLSANDGIILQERTGKIRVWNHAAEKVFGISADEAYELSYADHIWKTYNEDGTFLPGTEHPSMVTFASGEPCMNRIMKVERNNCDYSWINVNTTPIFKNNESTPCSVVITFSDITERKQAERILQSRLNISEYAIEHSLDELLTKVLDEAEALTDSRIGFFHFVAPDQVTLSLQTWSSNTKSTYCTASCKGQHYPLDQAGVWADCLRKKRALIHNDYESLPNRKGLPPGHAPLQRELVVPIFRNKRVVALLGVGNKKVDYIASEIVTLQHLANLAWDIITRKKTEVALQESETRFRSIMDLAPNIAVQGYTLEGTTTYWNHASEIFYGYTREEAIGKNLLDLIIPPEMRDSVREAIRRMGETGTPVPAGELELMRKDTSRIPVYSSHALLQPAGREPELFCMDIDLTEGKQAEEALKQKQQQLEALNQSLETRINSALAEMRRKDDMLIQQGRLAAMGEMINNIAHQWRQPLNNLGLIVQNLKLSSDLGELLPGEVDENVSKAMNVILHMSRTIDDFRNFFKYEKEPSLFNVNQVVSSALNFVSPGLKSSGIEVEWDEQPDISAKGYPNEYMQAILNILNNAKDALLELKTPNPLISIRIYSEKKRSIVTIRDNGGGINQDILPKIFDPYFSTKGHGQGTGLGLYMSKAIIEKNMGGRLSVSNIGGGAEFRIEI